MAGDRSGRTVTRAVRGLGALLLLALLALPGPGLGVVDGAGAQAAEELQGTFRLDAGECAPGGPVTAGSHFRMTQADGSFLANTSSPCEFSYTPLSPGTQGGLVTGDYQPHPDPACQKPGGHGLADRIHAPQPFLGVRFGTATQRDVIRGGSEVAPPPTVTFDPASGELSGDLSALSICWSGLFFAQGSPRPEGLPTAPFDNACPEPQPSGEPSMPVGGTYDPETGAYALDWSSRIGGSFGCTFTGHWHFVGSFTTEVLEPGTLTESEQGERGGGLGGWSLVITIAVLSGLFGAAGIGIVAYGRLSQ